MAPPSGALSRTLTHLVSPSENHLGRLLGRVGFARIGRTLSHPYLDSCCLLQAQSPHIRGRKGGPWAHWRAKVQRAVAIG